MTEVKTAEELNAWARRRRERRKALQELAARRTVDVNPKYESIWRATRRIETPKSVGTGCLVRHWAGQFVVTNAHVVDGCPSMVCQDLSGCDLVSLPARLVAIDYTHDLAVLQVEPQVAGESDGITIGNSPRPGDPVTVCGFPLGCATPRLSQGIISGFADLPIEGHRVASLVVQAPVNQGNSGGPVCAEDGSLAGIVWAMNPRLRPGFARPTAPTARQAIEYMEQALVPVDGFAYVLNPADIRAMLDSHAYVRGLGQNGTTNPPTPHQMLRQAFVDLQRQVAELAERPPNSSCIGPFNVTPNRRTLLLGFHDQDNQVQLAAPAEWLRMCRSHFLRGHSHFYLRGYTVVVYHRNPAYHQGIWVDRVQLDLV